MKSRHVHILFIVTHRLYAFLYTSGLIPTVNMMQTIHDY